ncbi:alpha/beta hydrolase [Rossellomorea vietnamensis]|uniref:alpha/beta hydrolase n=1 Tax=Rossellomorea vietnamensis TaxID=218284 RepID=UPI003CF263B8
MPRIECSFYSEVLSKVVSMSVLLPQETVESLKQNREVKYPTLFLLHGFSDHHNTWIDSTSLQRYVEGRGLAVVMPAVDNSYYTDMVYGGDYWKFLTEEILLKARTMFPLSDKREDTFVAGHSMGGFGALKWGLNKPEVFGAIASMSGVADMVFHLENVRKQENDKKRALTLVFGENDISQTENDILWKLEELALSDEKQPMLYQTCGTEDFLYEHNVRFHNKSKELNLSTTTEFLPGDHTWEFWDAAIQRVLSWLPIKN